MKSTPQQYSCRRGKARTRIHKIAHWTHWNTQIYDYYGYVLASVCAEVYSSMSMCMAASICMFVYCICVCEHVRKGGWVAEVRWLSYYAETRVSASPSRPEQALQHALIARKKRESKNWKLAVIAMRKNLPWLLICSISDAYIQISLISKQEIMGNQTLVDWLVVSGGIPFEPEWDSKDGMKIEEKHRGSEGGRVGGESDRRKEKTGNMRVEDTTTPVGIEQLTCLSCLILDMSENVNLQATGLISLFAWTRWVVCQPNVSFCAFTWRRSGWLFPLLCIGSTAWL